MNTKTQNTIGPTLSAGTTERGTDSIRTEMNAITQASIYTSLIAGTLVASFQNLK